MSNPTPNPKSNYYHVCQPCDKCSGCQLECEHQIKTTVTSTYSSPNLRQQLITAICFKPDITGHIEQFEAIEALIAAHDTQQRDAVLAAIGDVEYDKVGAVSVGSRDKFQLRTAVTVIFGGGTPHTED